MILSHKQLQLISRLFFLLVPYFFIRLGFYFYHESMYRDFNLTDILASFLIGMRFDLAAIFILNLPILICSFFRSINQSFERILFVILNSICFFSSIHDYELFSFLGKRLSYDFFLITDDIMQQLPQITLYYWYLPLLALIFSISFYYIDKRFFNFRPREISNKRLYLVQFIISLVFFVGIRGGLQSKSINVQSAFVQGSNELGVLALNTPYFFLRTLKNKTQPKITFLKNNEVFNLINTHHENIEQDFQEKKLNVVLIILESFSMEYMEKGFTPYLTELSKKSLFMKRHLANGRRSIESLPSILCGLPALINEPISKSTFSGNKFDCFPKILKDNKYKNYFYHGGGRGTMGFESYTLSHGYDRYFSKSDYPDQSHFDGAWGIYDGPYLKYFANEISKMSQPFHATVFTLSSHQPYAIPKEFQNKFPKGSLEIHESIGYTDFSLKEFFNKIENTSWFKNTLFVITADHAQKHATKKFKNSVGQYRVPLLLYLPNFKWPEDYDLKVSQHADIPKTILNFLGINKEINSMSRSIFSKGKGQAFNYVDGNFYYRIEGDKFYKMNKSGEQYLAQYNWETGEFSALKKSDDKLLKAYVQYFINGLISNNLTLKQ